MSKPDPDLVPTWTPDPPLLRRSGRRARGDERPALVPVRARVDPDTAAFLEAETARRGLTQSALIALALAEWRDANRDYWEPNDA